MNAPQELRRNRNVIAGLASGVVLSLTVLTAGVAPAIADPGHGHGGQDPVAPAAPETTVYPQPEVVVPEPTKVAEAPAPVAAPVVPVAPQVAPVIPSTPRKVDVPDPAPVYDPPPQVAPQPQVQAVPPSSSVVQPPAGVVPTERSVAPPTAIVVPSVPDSKPSIANTPRQASPPTVDKVPNPAPVAAAPTPAVAKVSPPLGVPTEEQPPALEAANGPAALPSASAVPDAELRKDGLQSTSGPETTGALAPSTPQDGVSAAQSIKAVEPRTLDAPEADVTVAKLSKPLEEKPNPAPETDVVALRSSVELQDPNRGNGDDKGGGGDDQFRDQNGPRHDDHEWDHNVRQFDRNWVQYDQFYRPIICNPFRAPLRIVYVYLNAPRILIIPALASAVVEVAQLAAYSFTAVVDTAANLVNAAAQVAVGTFFGGGYYPGAGLPAPIPPRLQRYDNVPVQVRYGQDVYQPFRVQQIVDAGDDPVYGERKVLLDGMTPAWGQWTQTPGGERQFEVHKTQQFPGLDEPSQGPLPGNYQLSLASDESSAGLSRRDVYLIVAAVTMAALSLSAVILSMALGRRRREF